MGFQPLARRPRVGHHRLDERRRQDRCAQDRDQEPADAIAGRRHPQWRRLRVDHPVQQKRQSRSQQLRWELDRLDRLESEPAILKTSKPNNWNQIGPGSSCPFTSSNYGFRCTAGPANNSATVSTIPASGSYSGYICPGVDGGNKDSTKIGIYYNGCYNSCLLYTSDA